MTKLIFNNNNTEGHYTTSFDFIDTEVRKDDKIVATDLIDLYDVELTNVQNGEILVYNSTKQKWVNGEAGAGCNTTTHNKKYSIGQFGDFISLNECFNWLRNNCKIIKEYNTITIYLKENIDIKEHTSLNHPYGHRIIIDGDYNEIRTHYDDIIDNNISLSHSHNITIKNTFIKSSYVGDDLEEKYAFIMNTDGYFTPYIRNCFLTNHDNIIYCFGGLEYDGSGNLINNNKKVYKCESVLYSRWEEYDTNIPYNVIVSEYCIKYNNKILLFNNNNNGFDTIWVYNFDTNIWSESAVSSGDIPSTDDITAGYTLSLYNDKVYLIGGYPHNNSIYIYDIISNSWSKLADILGIMGYIYHSSYIYDDKIYIYGGQGTNDQENFNGLLSFDLLSNDINIIIPNTSYHDNSSTPYKRGLYRHHSYINDDGIMFIYSGIGKSISNPYILDAQKFIYTYNIRDNIWNIHDDGIYGYANYGFTVLNDISYILGGYVAYNNISGKRYPSNKFVKIHNNEKVFEIDNKPSSEFITSNKHTYTSSLVITNNSLINTRDVVSIANGPYYRDPVLVTRAIEISYHNTYIIEKLNINLFEINNNSLFHNDGYYETSGHINSMLIYNNSSLYMEPPKNVWYTIKNGSMVLSSNIQNFTNSTFVNSKLIEKK